MPNVALIRSHDNNEVVGVTRLFISSGEQKTFKTALRCSDTTIADDFFAAESLSLCSK